MQDRYIGRLEPGMDVCDINGDKIGTIGHVFRHELAAVESQTSSVATMPRQEIIEVKTGLLSLGKHLYMPLGAIHDVTSGCVFVSEPKERVDAMGWDVKPDYLDELT